MADTTMPMDVEAARKFVAQHDAKAATAASAAEQKRDAAEMNAFRASPLFAQIQQVAASGGAAHPSLADAVRHRDGVRALYGNHLDPCAVTPQMLARRGSGSSGGGAPVAA
jgi:hypothetical protein